MAPLLCLGIEKQSSKLFFGISAVHLRLKFRGVLMLGDNAVDFFDVGGDHIPDDAVLDGGHRVAVL